MTVSVTVKILPIYNELGGENQELKKKKLFAQFPNVSKFLFYVTILY